MKNLGMKKLIDSDRNVVKEAIEQHTDLINSYGEKIGHGFSGPKINLDWHPPPSLKLKPKGEIYGGIITLQQTQTIHHIDFINSLNSSRDVHTIENLRIPHHVVWNLLINNRGPGEVGLSINKGSRSEDLDLTYILGKGEIFDTSDKYPTMNEPIFNNMNISCLSAGSATIGVALFV